MCITALLSLFGCGKNDRHILDGPGMVSVAEFKRLDISKSDSHSQYNFSFTLEESEFSYFVSGECRDKNGTVYELESGACELSHEDFKYFKDLKLDLLPDVKEAKEQEEIIKLTYSDGVTHEKSADTDMTADFYNRLLPYFIKHGHN